MLREVPLVLSQYSPAMQAGRYLDPSDRRYHGPTHLTCGWTQTSGKEFLMLEVDTDGTNKLPAIEERPNGDLHSGDAALQLSGR